MRRCIRTARFSPTAGRSRRIRTRSGSVIQSVTGKATRLSSTPPVSTTTHGSTTSGIRQGNSYGGDLRNTGAAFSARLRPDGSIVPRKSLIAPAQNRTDVRLQQRIKLHGRLSIDGIAEIFNLFNRPNFGIGVQENNPQYLQNISAQTRTMQFGFRLLF